eukprot:TRINITY_DN2163_c0_g1_i1.p1 TRINITY_DN2163_c0_g1~~TRINITY_DN2163_c0_g1_i1.p1  ORF type:complete len:652 (-),score=153.45 TRINITY_DN2163_c0_g1_i1:29-1984(-)
METGDGTGRSSFDPSPNTSGGFSQNNGSLRREIIAMQDDQPGNRGTFAIPETFREKPVRTLFKIHLPAKQGFLTIDYVATMNLKEVLQIVAKKRRLQTDGGSFSHLKSKEEIPLTTILGDLDVDCLKLRLPGLNNDDSIIDFHSGANAQRAPRDLNIQRSTFFSVPNLDSPSGSLTSTHATLRPNGSPSMNTSPPSSTTTSPNSTLRPEMNKKSSFIFPTIRAEIVQGDIAVVGPLPSEEPDLDESLVTLPPPPGSSNITSNRASHDSEDSFTITPLTHDPPPPSRDVIPEKKAMRPPLPARTANKTSQRPPIAPASSGNPSPARPSGPRPVRRPPMADSSAIVPTPPSTEWKSNPITEASPSGPIIGVMPRDSFFQADADYTKPPPKPDHLRTNQDPKQTSMPLPNQTTISQPKQSKGPSPIPSSVGSDGPRPPRGPRPARSSSESHVGVRPPPSSSQESPGIRSNPTRKDKPYQPIPVIPHSALESSTKSSNPPSAPVRSDAPKKTTISKKTSTPPPSSAPTGSSNGPSRMPIPIRRNANDRPETPALPRPPKTSRPPHIIPQSSPSASPSPSSSSPPKESDYGRWNPPDGVIPASPVGYGNPNLPANRSSRPNPDRGSPARRQAPLSKPSGRNPRGLKENPYGFIPKK